MLTIRIVIALLFTIMLIFIPQTMQGCSTFEVRQGDHIAYAHNMNQGDLGVPGMVFINKRGILKESRTWDELTTTNPTLATDYAWISRYGSVTVNIFGRDFPDGGVNEEGLYIWEMGEDVEYPNDPEKPAMNQMNWMQYILDTCLNVEDAIQRANEVTIDGWGWHYFVGDALGNTAYIAFADGKPLVRTGADMPVPAVFNSPYDWEMELERYYKGFGGNYPTEVDDPRVPRFVRYQRLMREMKPTDNVVDYGIMMMQTLRVHDDPEWSVLYDEDSRTMHFRTRLNPAVKTLKLSDIDFTNQSPTLMLDIDQPDGGDMISRFEAYTKQADKSFMMEKLVPKLPDSFFSKELTGEACVDNFVNRIDADGVIADRLLEGIWGKEKNKELVIALDTKQAAVTGYVIINNNGDHLAIDHLSLMGNVLRLTFFTPNGAIVEAVCTINGDKMKVRLNGAEDFYGNFALERE